MDEACVVANRTARSIGVDPESLWKQYPGVSLRWDTGEVDGSFAAVAHAETGPRAWFAISSSGDPNLRLANNPARERCIRQLISAVQVEFKNVMRALGLEDLLVEVVVAPSSEGIR